jgi:hypothetical protein
VVAGGGMTYPSTGRYLLGVAAFLVTFGALGFAALRVRRRWLHNWDGAAARLAEAVIGLALLVAMLELLGTVGLFRLVPVVVGSVLIGAAAGRIRLSDRPLGHSAHALSVTVAGVIAAAGTFAVLAEWSAVSLQSYDFGIRTFDSVWYHLPWAAGFAQTGHITPLRFTDVEYLTAFYPATAELFHGLGIVLFARDTASPAINLVWLGLVLLAAYCVGRPRGLGALTMMGAVLALATRAIDLSQAGSAANDVVGVFFLLASVALLINGGERRFPFALAAVSAGLAVGVKLSMLAPALALSVGAIAVSPRGRRGTAAALWLVPLVLAGCFWYARNLITVGNPLPWLSIPGLTKPAPPLQQHTGFSVAHYIVHGQGWNRFFEPGLAAGLGPWWYVIVALVIVGPLLCLLPGADRMVRMLGVVALVSLLAYIVTPETAAGPEGEPLGFGFNLRYAMPVLTLSLTLLPLAPTLSRGARRRVLVALGLALVLTATLAQGRLWPSRHAAGALGVTAVVVAIGALGALLARQRTRVPALAAATALILAGAAAGYSWQRHYLRGRYAYHPGVSSLSRVWALFRDVHHARVGVVGTFGGFFSYPLFGVDDSNRVEYVGARGPHGSFTAITSCAGWRTAVNHGHFDYLVTTPGRDPWHPKPLRPSPEGGWTHTDAAASVVYSRRATGQTISVFALRGRLDPSGCP